MSSTTLLWTAIGEHALAELAANGWRRWPNANVTPVLDRAAAVAEARRVAREESAGFVIKLEIRNDPAVRIEQRPLERSELESLLAAAMSEDAEYRRAVTEEQLARTEKTMGLRFPTGWRAYLRRDTWFRRGWLTNEEYVWLYEPQTSVATWSVWRDLQLHDRPGMIPIGTDGGSEFLTGDGRDPQSPVTLTATACEGWKDSILQTKSVDAFTDAIDAGTFTFVFEAE